MKPSKPAIARQNQANQAAPPTERYVRLVALLLVVALILSLIPLYAVAQYSYAGVDDYRYGQTTHAVWTQTRSFGKTLAEAARIAGETYHTWQGSLTAIFLMALQPGIFHSNLYWLSTAFLLTVLVFSLLYFLFTLLNKLFDMSRWEALALSALGAICCVQFVPVPVESYYWFNGGVYYTFYFSLSLIAAGLLIRRRQRKTLWQWILLLPILLLIGTGNLVTGLLSCVGLFLYALWAWTMAKERDPLLLCAVAVLLAAFAVNALAPGNGVRQMEHAESAQGPISAILAAMGDAGQYSFRWLGSPAPWALLLCTPFIWQWAGCSSWKFRFPLLVSVASFLLLAAGFAPNEYALSFPGEARVMDIQFYLFVLLTLINLVYYTGWLRKRWQPSARTAKRSGAAILAAGVLLCGLFILRTRDVSAVSAYRVCRNGDGRSYAAVWESRLEMLQAPGNQPVVLEKFTHQPPLLCMVDIAVDESGEYYWYNQQLAEYFGKDQVLREP